MMSTEFYDRNEDWPDDLDAMTAAPDHHALLLENDKVRVLDSVVRPGDSTPIHTHRWPGVLYIVGSSEFVREDDRGNILFDSRTSVTKPQPGSAVWSGPLQPHFVTNVGESDIRVISIEIKD